jgi:GNAT superfamily N-acetyltransferase
VSRATFEVRRVEAEDEVLGCFPLIQQLRPQLASPQDFLVRWRGQAAEGYRLAGLFDGEALVSLAGYRLQSNLIHGLNLYVDDLVTDETRRGGGSGAQLMRWLKEEARALGCARLVLDTPLANVLGHRFYYRNGLLATALRFGLPL